MKQPKTSVDLATIDPKNLPELQGFEAKQKALVKENPYVEITDNATYEVAKKHRTALVTGRTDLQKQDKLIATKLKELRTKSGEIIQGLIDITLPFEEKQQEEVKRYEAIKEAEREAKAEEERKRVQSIKDQLDASEIVFQAIIDAMEFSNIEERRAVLGTSIVSAKDNFDFAEFESMFDQMAQKKTAAFEVRVEELKLKENQRLENERLKKEAEDAKKRGELMEARLEALRKYEGHGPDYEVPALPEMSDKDFKALLTAKEAAFVANEARLEKERKDQDAREAAERKKQEELQAELDKMKREKEEREAAERAAKEKAENEAREKAEAEAEKKRAAKEKKENAERAKRLNADKEVLFAVISDIESSFVPSNTPAMKNDETSNYLIYLHNSLLEFCDEARTEIENL